MINICVVKENAIYDQSHYCLGVNNESTKTKSVAGKNQQGYL
jgi:hypothetical protein